MDSCISREGCRITLTVEAMAIETHGYPADEAHRHGRRPRGRNEFIADLGLELQGERPAEGRWVNRAMTLEASEQNRVPPTPDGHG
jgi:hypothetical protein